MTVLVMTDKFRRTASLQQHRLKDEQGREYEDSTSHSIFLSDLVVTVGIEGRLSRVETSIDLAGHVSIRAANENLTPDKKCLLGRHLNRQRRFQAAASRYGDRSWSQMPRLAGRRQPIAVGMRRRCDIRQQEE
jgi:hypothetical protein